jgi:NTE family protein
MMKKYKLGIALGGGGSRGFAHLGILKALFERDIVPDIISGTSAGSIVGVFIADKKTPDEILNILKEKGFFKYTSFNIPKTGLVGLEGLEKQLHEDLSTDDLEKLAIPMIAAVTNLNKGRAEYFSKGAPEKIIQASSAIPVLFSPVEINGQLYADGGLLDNVPVDILRDQCEKVIGIDISPVTQMDEIENLFHIALRTFQLSVSASSHNLKNRCDLLIAPEECSEYDLLNAKQADELFEMGYEYAKNMDLSAITG